MLKLGLHGRSLEELELACQSITTSKVNYSIEDENGGAVVVFSSADSDKVEPNLVCSVNQFLSALPLRHPSKALLHPNKRGAPSERLSQKIRESLDICREAIERYGLDSVALSFNGGKDCTVLLHLLREVIPKDKLKLLTFYFVPENSFPEVEDFSQGCVSDYNLDICRFQCSVREGLSKIKDNYPHIKAIFAGTRSTDPYSSHLNHFSITDKDWPQFMRISPILHWDYSDVWEYLTCYDIKYCVLYDRGYTSLGSIDNTLPNESLKNDQSPYGYDPAFMLKDGSKERESRVSFK